MSKKVTAASLAAALDRTPGTNVMGAALLLALPVDAAPGIDLFYNASQAGFRGVVVPRSDDPVDTALRLHSAYAPIEPLAAFRDLSADPAEWVGWYRSGTHLYSAGMWEFLGCAEIAVPAEPEPPLFELVEAVSAAPHTHPGRPYPLPVSARTVDGSSGMYVVRFPSNPAQNFAQVACVSSASPDLPPTDEASTPGSIWDVFEEAAAQVAATLGAESVLSVPLSANEAAAELELLVTMPEGLRLVVPVAVDLRSKMLQVGLPLARLNRAAMVSDPGLPGFEVVGADRTEPGVVLRHTDSGLFCLLPAV